MAECCLSVVIPCHNYGQYLGEAIRSVLHQEGFGDGIEVVVINDHSTDAMTLRSLSYWGTAAPQVRVFDNPGILGAATARNLGIDRASGEWIAFLDADDIWLPKALQARWRVLQIFPDAQWIGADYLRWHEDGNRDVDGFFKSCSAAHEKLRHAYASGTIMRLAKPVAEFLRMSFGWTSTIMAKKALLLNVGGFEGTLGNYEDHHLWIRIAREADFYFVPEVVSWYREHPMSVSRKEGPPAYWYITAMGLLLQDPNFRPYKSLIHRKLVSLFEQNMYYHRTRGETSLATVAAAHAILSQPTRIAGWRNLIASVIGRK